jgi:peptidoglycan/LPS O-acetylase OafA/YrhL
VLEALLWASVLLATLVAPLRLHVLLTNRAIGAVGILSYSIYLLHFPIMFEVFYRWDAVAPKISQGWTPGAFGTVLVCFALVLAVSPLTYLFIERPVLERKARIND